MEVRDGRGGRREAAHQRAPATGEAVFHRGGSETFDGEKSLPYHFDTIVRLYRDEKGRFLGECLKDRSNKMPRGQFESSYSTFERAFGPGMLVREARPVPLATEEQRTQIQDFITRFGMTPEQVSQRLAAYGADGLEDLTEESAQAILSKLEAATKREDGESGKDTKADA